MKISSVKCLLIAGLFGMAAAGVNAQTLWGSYFLESAPYRHQLNPALMPNGNYVAIPVLGNIHFGVNSSASYSTFIYSVDGYDKLQTFLSSAVSVDDFEKKLRNKNSISFDMDLSILSFGFYKWNGFNTFDLSLRSRTAMTLPGDLFRLLKEGNPDDGKYNLKHLSMSQDTYFELALGHARDLTDEWAVGAKVKALVGGAHFRTKFNRFDLTMSEDLWEVNYGGSADANLSGLEIITDEDGNITDAKFESNRAGVSGGGFGFDLGVTYKPIDNLVVSAALTNLGFICWNKNTHINLPKNTPFSFSGFTDIGDNTKDDKGKTSLDRQIDDLFKEDFEYNVTTANTATALAPTLTIGGEYSILQERISFGLLSATTFYPRLAHTRLMASVNLKPLRFIQFALNGSVSNLAQTWGAVLKLGPLFLGAEFASLRVTPQYIPVGKVAANVNLGLSVPFGRKPEPRKLSPLLKYRTR